MCAVWFSSYDTAVVLVYVWLFGIAVMVAVIATVVAVVVTIVTIGITVMVIVVTTIAIAIVTSITAVTIAVANRFLSGLFSRLACYSVVIAR